jgi:hypothetical protein
MVRARRFGLVAFLVGLAVSLAACPQKPQLGGKCNAGQAACVDAKSGLFCSAEGTYKAMTCSGAGGCTLTGTKVECDNDVAEIGDGCDTPDDGACTADHKSLLQCKSDKFLLVDTCKGPGACKIDKGSVACDNNVADIGDPCSNKGNFACTSDKATALRCDDGHYASIQSCRGPNACVIVRPKSGGAELECDYSVANENDPCIYPGYEACSSDKAKMFTCKGGKYTDATPCPGPAGCTAKVTKKSAKATCDGAGGTTPPAPDPSTNPPKHHHHQK